MTKKKSRTKFQKTDKKQKSYKKEKSQSSSSRSEKSHQIHTRSSKKKKHQSRHHELSHHSSKHSNRSKKRKSKNIDVKVWSNLSSHIPKSSSHKSSHYSSHHSSAHSNSNHSNYAKSHYPDKPSATTSIPKSVIEQIQKILSMKPPIMVRNESAIKTAGYSTEKILINSTEYSQILVAHKSHKKEKSKKSKKSNDDGNDEGKSSDGHGKIVVKITNLTECSPRFRANLVKNSVRIMRFIGSMKNPPSVFMKIYEIFQVEGVKLYVFMEECQPNPTLYDIVRAPAPIKPEDIRVYFRALAFGVNALQKMGVAHRYIKLQHVLFDQNNRPKLCGWSKSVIAYDIDNKTILMQHEERRVRRNYFLPPEAFNSLYDPLKADIWSLGVILVAMCTKRYPFNVRDDRIKCVHHWREFTRLHEMNVNVRNLCNKIFVKNPKNRITSDKILSDKYFKVSKAQLVPLSIRSDAEAFMKESSRVGAVSAADFMEEGNQSKNNVPEEQQPAELQEGQAEEGSELEEENASGKEEPGKVQDGGAVGQEEANLTPEEALNESHLSDKAAPEEEENKAIPQASADAIPD